MPRWTLEREVAAARRRGDPQQKRSSHSVPRWDFLTNQAHVLTCVAHGPGIRLRDIAAAVGITERAAHRILSELVEEGYVLRERQGRRNRYQVVAGRPLRHPLFQEREVGDLLEVLIGSATAESASTAPLRV
ncbi:MAG: helix-turn-helix transcriptional regulator [Gaiellaceae bacterium]